MGTGKNPADLIAQIRQVLDELERATGVTGMRRAREQKRVQRAAPNDYSGPSGGVQLLLDEGFFKAPKSVAAVEDRLHQEGYHYRQSAVAMALLRAVRRRLLTRLPSNEAKEKWNYAERK